MLVNEHELRVYNSILELHSSEDNPRENALHRCSVEGAIRPEAYERGGKHATQGDRSEHHGLRVGKLSLSGLLYLKSLGYRNVKSMNGGMTAWVEKGLPTE